jgi:hypothetical protein
MAAFTRTVGPMARTFVMKEGESELLRNTSPSNKGGIDFPEGAHRP